MLMKTLQCLVSNGITKCKYIRIYEPQYMYAALWTLDNLCTAGRHIYSHATQLDSDDWMQPVVLMQHSTGHLQFSVSCEERVVCVVHAQWSTCPQSHPSSTRSRPDSLAIIILLCMHWAQMCAGVESVKSCMHNQQISGSFWAWFA